MPYPTGSPRRSLGGFTLIELIIAVTIIGILAAIAFPSYQRYVQRGHESAAQSFLLELSNLQERFLLDRRAYASSLAALGASTPSELSGRYEISFTVPAGNPPQYTLT